LARVRQTGADISRRGSVAAATSHDTMADNEISTLPAPSPEQRRAAAGQFERANQVIATGNFEYGIQLLLSCCKLDPGNLIYRQALRQTEKTKYKNNMHGSAMAAITTSGTKAKILAAKRSKDYLKVLELGEDVLVRNPWDTGALMDMADAAEQLGLMDMATWSLEQARLKNPKSVPVNRALAKLCERRGNFSQAIGLWELVRQADPKDMEARTKAKDIAANATIARGRYEAVINESGERAGTETKPGFKSEKGDTPVRPDKAEPLTAVQARAGGERFAQEIAALRTRIQNDPTSPATYLQLAALYRRSNQDDQARAVLTEGLGPTGNAFDLTIELAEMDIEPFRKDLAIAEEKLKAQPQDEELRKICNRFQKEVNTREMDLFRQKADRFPTDKTFRFDLGVRLLRAGQFDEAIKELQALRSDPRYQWRALLYLGYCFNGRNNWRLAQRNFEEALQNLPAGDEESRKEILFQLAEGMAKAGDLAKAVELGYELANVDFGYNDIGRLLDEWQNRMQQADISG
jgi:tetratricopeptide (TPR) repeat protein